VPALHKQQNSPFNNKIRNISSHQQLQFEGGQGQSR
jgi:hypothetical protein